MKKKFLTTILTFCLIGIFASNCISQDGHKNLLQGDKYYESGNFYLAEEQYRKAREQEKELKSSYNLGNAVYQQGRYEEAVDHFTTATQLATDNATRANAYYNLGNSLFDSKKLDEAIDAYKEAIQLDPENDKARYNLLMAKLLKKSAQEQDQEQQQQNQEQNDENKDQQDQQNQDQQQQQQQDQQEQGEDSQEQEQDQQQQEQDSTQQDENFSENASFDTTRLEKQNLDSLDAIKLLQIIQNEEQKVQEKLKKFNSSKKKPDKDW